MWKQVLTLFVLWLAIAPAAAEHAPPVMFDRKYFTDLGNIVAVEGSPTGEGANPNTTRFVLTCYQERRECSAILIKAYGTLISILTAIPLTYSIAVWAPDRVVANHDLACGNRETWLVDRLTKTAELSVGSCDGGETHHWTIEDPPSWKKADERLGD